jgi:hypothetical protein
MNEQRKDGNEKSRPDRNKNERRWWFYISPWRWKRKKSLSHTLNEPLSRPPIREFVYLDEISLKSLLVSQQGTLLTETTINESIVEQAEMSNKLVLAPKNVGFEMGSRYQATGTAGSQTLRKSVAQSQFKELLELENLQILFSDTSKAPKAKSVNNLTDEANRQALSAGRLRRGELIEVEVELSADPIYRFSATMSELSDLAEKYPEMVGAPGAADVLGQMGPVNRVLQQLLVGLVPIRARCTNLSAVEIDGEAYVIRTEAATAVDHPLIPIDVVGVTELHHFWKDARRVLFSGSKFKMLCRVSKDGLQDSWNAVKGAEVLSEILPTFPAMLEKVGRTEYAVPEDSREVVQRTALKHALIAVANRLNDGRGMPLSSGRQVWLESLIEAQLTKVGTASGQKKAFDAVMDQVEEWNSIQLSPDERHRLRSEARKESGLEYSMLNVMTTAVPTKQRPAGNEKLMDVEIVAIYW